MCVRARARKQISDICMYVEYSKLFFFVLQVRPIVTNDVLQLSIRLALSFGLLLFETFEHL